MAFAVILLARLLVPLSILRLPLLGALLAIAADTFDNTALHRFGWGSLTLESYQLIDKFLDLYYLSFMAFVARRWEGTAARKTAGVLYWIRFAGVALFAATGVRQFLFFAPNIFENFYILVALARWGGVPPFVFERRKYLLALLLVAAVPKIIQEYVMHFLEFPLSFSVGWQLFRRQLFGP